MSLSTVSTALKASNAFWWQWPCTSARSAIFFERQIETARLRLARQKFLEGQRLLGEPLRALVLDHAPAFRRGS